MGQASYLYAYGRIKALESKLFGFDKFSRMLESETADEALKILYENSYGDGTVIDNVSKIEEMLENEKRLTVDLVTSITAEKASTDAILIRYDYHNAKALVKEKYFKIDMKESLTYGTIDADTLKELIFADNYSDLPVDLRKALELIDEEFSKGNRSPKFVDLILDKAMYKDIANIVKKSSSKLLNQYVEEEIDLINIKNLLRVKLLKLESRELTQSFIEGGSLSEEKLSGLVEVGFDLVAEHFKYTKYGEIVSKAITSINENKGLSQLEVDIDNRLLKIFSSNKILLSGIDPLLGYLLAKLTEIKNIRIIMISLNNKVDREVVKERLRESYVQ